MITDDGVAMGYTLEAAVGCVHEQSPGRIILALPVGPAETIERISRRADETLCLNIPAWFEGVSQFYENFPQVEEPEIFKILEQERLRRLQIKENNSHSA